MRVSYVLAALLILMVTEKAFTDVEFLRALQDELANDNLLEKLLQFIGENGGEEGTVCRDVLNPLTCEKLNKESDACKKKLGKRFCRKTCGCEKSVTEGSKRETRTFPPIPPPSKRSENKKGSAYHFIKQIQDAGTEMKTFPPIQPPIKRSESKDDAIFKFKQETRDVNKETRTFPPIPPPGKLFESDSEVKVNHFAEKTREADKETRTFPPIPAPGKLFESDSEEKVYQFAEKTREAEKETRTFPPIPPPGKRSDNDYPADEENAMEQIAITNEAADLNLYESDIMMPPDHDDDRELSQEEKLSKRNAMRDKSYLWPHRKVPYVITSSIGSSGVAYDAIMNAMRGIEAKTCLRFIPRTTEINYINLFKGMGCWSYVGRIFYINGPQNISIGDGCQYKGTVMHELLHAIGIFHEQSRSDRDTYVEVLWENIMDGREKNFKKVSSEYSANYVNYDYSSIMHYGTHYFSKNGQPTLKALGQNSATYFGQRNEMSALDATEVNALYHCADASTTASGWSEWSEFSPCNGACYKRRQRFCTGVSGSNDCKGADSYGIINFHTICTPAECNAPIDGGWGIWQAWNSCSTTCDAGTRSRSRSCNQPTPSNGGANCAGASTVQETCNMVSCNAGPFDVSFDQNGWRAVWVLQVKDNTGWFEKTGTTPSSGTGPSGDHTTGSESYVYYESSYPAQPGDLRAVYSQKIPPNGGKRCISFWYHMYGEHMGSLLVFISSPYTELHKISGDQGNTWKQAQVTFDGVQTQQVGFISSRGNGFRSDMALDDIVITDGPCGNAVRSVMKTKPATSFKPSIIKGCNLPSPLGMMNGKIKNHQLSATSSLDSYHMPQHARLNGPAAWCAAKYQDFSSQYLQVDFKFPKLVSGIITQDLPEHPYNEVYEYMVQYSGDGETFRFYEENGYKKIIDADHHHGRESSFTFSKPIQAISLRIIPHSYSGKEPCLRFEINGCDGPKLQKPAGCKSDVQALGMASGAILDQAISSSSDSDPLTAGHLGRINHHTAWCSQPSKNGDKSHMKIDIGKPTQIVAIATQGRQSWDSWVLTYKIKTSDDKTIWTTYKENSVEKVFNGNKDRNSIVKHIFHSPISARYIEIVPLGHHGDQICMRIELYGCSA